MISTYQLVLVEQIHEYENKGWVLLNDRVHKGIGGWASVYMRKEGEHENT